MQAMQMLDVVCNTAFRTSQLQHSGYVIFRGRNVTRMFNVLESFDENAGAGPPVVEL